MTEATGISDGAGPPDRPGPRDGPGPCDAAGPPDRPGLLDGCVDFDPAGDLDVFLRRVPARWAVYLMSDAADRPAQLLCVKNLRVSLRRRLGPPDPAAVPSKRLDYRELVRRVRFRRVDSAFEADWVYHAAARAAFPATYRDLVGFRPAWFVHVDPAAAFPRYAKTTDLSPRAGPAGAGGVAGAGGTYVGPVEDKAAAGRLVELVEDAFDLCRFYPILTDAPAGKACAYKEMNKCPAPCDGTISMDGYRQMIALSLRALIDPRPAVRAHADRMRQAAADLRFEVAGKIKQHVDALTQLGAGPFRHARPLDDFRFLSLQHGPAAGSAQAFVVTPGEVRHVACLTAEPTAAGSGLLRLVFDLGQRPAPARLTPEQVERVGVVAHHLFAAKAQPGVFLPLAEVDDRTVAKAYRDLMKQRRPEETDGEGIVKELAAEG